MNYDDDFDDEDFDIPLQFQQQTAALNEEAMAARELPVLVHTLRRALIAKPYPPTAIVLEAVALVDASCTDQTDVFYRSDTWKLCYGSRGKFVGGSFREMRKLAQTCMAELIPNNEQTNHSIDPAYTSP